MEKYLRTLLLLQALLVVFATPGAHALRNDRRDAENSKPRAEQQLERIRSVMLPLLQATDQRIAIEEVRVTIVDEAKINAASGGNGQFYVTTGLLRQASDEQLRGVLAHEIAHEDLGHPTKAQVLGVGIGLGAALLEKVLPASSAVAPIAGTLVTGHYNRPMELAADRHAIKLLQRAGYSKNTMLNTLAWLMQLNGDTGGGIFATHPAISERIQALQPRR
ncbi:MAG: M48 family metallopeptidase [Candidatus Binatia bacterium]